MIKSNDDYFNLSIIAVIYKSANEKLMFSPAFISFTQLVNHANSFLN